MGALTILLIMRNYAFNIYLDCGDIICESILAASRLVAEMIIEDNYPNAIYTEFLSVY
mgnify:CR=1 FL=1